MADVKCKQTKFQNVNKHKINAYFNTMYLYQIINGKTVETRTFRISMLSKPWGSGSFSCSHFVQLTYNFPLIMLTVLTQLHVILQAVNGPWHSWWSHQCLAEAQKVLLFMLPMKRVVCSLVPGKRSGKEIDWYWLFFHFVCTLKWKLCALHMYFRYY